VGSARWAPNAPDTRVAQLKYFRFHAKQQCAARFEHARVSSKAGAGERRFDTLALT
jgi:hypothetical protein